jgi:hypothetical protein
MGLLVYDRGVLRPSDIYLSEPDIRKWNLVSIYLSRRTLTKILINRLVAIPAEPLLFSAEINSARTLF